MSAFLAYLSDVRRVSGSRLTLALMFVIAAALLEGVGLLAILPLFAVIAGEDTSSLGQSFIQLLERFGLETVPTQLGFLSLGFLCLLLLRAYLSWVRDVRLQRLSLGYVDHWRESLMRVISGADWGTVDQLRRGDLIHAVTTDVARLSVATSLFLRTLASAGLALIQVLIVAALSPRLFLFVFILGLAGLMIAWPVTRRATRLGQSLSLSGREAHRALHDLVSSQKLARLSNAENHMAESYIKEIGQTREQQVQFVSEQSASRALFQIIGGTIALATLWLGYVVLDTPLAVLAITLVVMIRVISPIQIISSTIQHIAHALPAFKGLTQIRDDLQATQTPALKSPKESCFKHSNGPARIELKALCFHHAQSDQPVLKGVSAHIESGEFVALVGRSGAGKTTLLDLITGLRQADSGSIIVDDQCLQSPTDFRAWRDQIAYLPQNPFLFDGTVRDNLLWSLNEKAPDERLWEALKFSGADTFLEQRAEGLNLRVGERGESLSGGERQLVCLARAYLREPRCLILDEATNSMDQTTEKAVMQRLENWPQRPTILLVTHQSNTLEHVDRVLHLEGGDIISKAEIPNV